MHRSWITIFALMGALCLPGAAAAQCDVTYQVQPGDTLFSMAEVHYGDREKWTLIYYANQGVLGGGDQTVPGQDMYIPCPAESAAPDADAPTQVEAGLTLLTGSNYAPFADRDWPEQGLATELVNAALELSPSPIPHQIAWEDDWGQHLFPLLDQKSYDMGFPWQMPDCDARPDTERCARFHFSDPLMDLPIMLFKRANTGFSYESDADIPGRRLCRPAGYATDDLDRADRRWLTEEAITLVQPDTPEACFTALMAGEVDAVTVNVFLGANKIVTMGLRAEVVPIDLPLSNEKLHVVISKSHWRGTAHLYRINAGLDALRKSGRYDEIVTRHLEIFWDQLD